MEELNRRISELERQVESLEVYSRRNNLIFYGVREDRRNDYSFCAEQIVYLLNSCTSDSTWCLDDIERAHRLGKKYGGNARPLIVKLCRWKDKLYLLSDRQTRDRLRQKKIRIASDLTKRQKEEQKKAREGGAHAFWKSGRLQTENVRPPNISARRDDWGHGPQRQYSGDLPNEASTEYGSYFYGHWNEHYRGDFYTYQPQTTNRHSDWSNYQPLSHSGWPPLTRGYGPPAPLWREEDASPVSSASLPVSPSQPLQHTHRPHSRTSTSPHHPSPDVESANTKHQTKDNGNPSVCANDLDKPSQSETASKSQHSHIAGTNSVSVENERMSVAEGAVKFQGHNFHTWTALTVLLLVQKMWE